MCFFIQNFQTHYCTYSGEDHVPVGVLLLSMRTRGHGGGKSSSHSLLFSPHPWESLLACYLLLYLHLSSSMSLFQHIFVSFVTISPVSSFQGHVACQNFTLTVPPLQCSCGRDDEINPSSRGSTDQRLKCTLFYFAGV